MATRTKIQKRRIVCHSVVGAEEQETEQMQRRIKPAICWVRAQSTRRLAKCLVPLPYFIHSYSVLRAPIIALIRVLNHEFDRALVHDWPPSFTRLTVGLKDLHPEKT